MCNRVSSSLMLTDLCGSTNVFVKSVAMLGNVEENDTVSRALARLSEVEEKVETLHTDQVCVHVAAVTVTDTCTMYTSSGSLHIVRCTQ